MKVPLDDKKNPLSTGSIIISSSTSRRSVTRLPRLPKMTEDGEAGRKGCNEGLILSAFVGPGVKLAEGGGALKVR